MRQLTARGTRGSASAGRRTRRAPHKGAPPMFALSRFCPLDRSQRVFITGATIALLTLSTWTARVPLDSSWPPGTSHASAAPDAFPARGASTAWVNDTYAKLPLSFEANVG